MRRKHCRMMTRTAFTLSRVEQAQRGLMLYFGFVVLFSGTVETIMILARSMSSWGIVVLMWTPGLSAILARLILHEGFSDVSFRLVGRGGFAVLLKALFLPVLIGLLGYGAAWITGVARFVVPTNGWNVPPVIRIIALLFVLLTVMTALNAFSAAGEELGWRGYMLTRLNDAGVKRPVLVSGLVWGIWHLPLILSGLYTSTPLPIVSAGLFMITITSLGYIIGRLRLESGSIWPAIIFHAAWNAVIAGGFDGLTGGAMTWLWTGESGILIALASLLVALIFEVLLRKKN